MPQQRKPKPSTPDLEPDESSQDSEVETNRLAAMLGEAMAQQRRFIEDQFSGLNGKLDAIKTDLANCTKDVQKLRGECTDLRKKMEKAEKTTEDNKAGLEAKLADLEDRSRRDNIRIMGIAEGDEGSNAVQYISSNLPKWFPSLREERFEIMRAHRLPLPRGAGASGSRTLICKMLRFTDRDRILKAARLTPLTIGDRSIRFSADYSQHTIARRRLFSAAMDTARKRGVQAFLLYPARLKVIRGSLQRVFDSHTEAEDFLNAQKPLEAGD